VTVAADYKALYGTQRWRRLSRLVIARAGGLCEVPGCPNLATTADHVIPALVLAERGELAAFFDPANLRAACFARARHLTVHYPQRGELARILRAARDVEARVWRDDERRAARYLWPQHVMEHALWPRGAEHRPEIEFAHDLTQAFVGVFKAALHPYLARVGVGMDDLTYIERGDGRA
jgi:hypothetical protein